MPLTVRDVMRPEVRSVSPDLPLPELEAAFLEASFGAFPVVADGELVGLVSRSDVVRQLVTERSLQGVLSDFYVDVSGFGAETEPESLTGVAERVGARIEGLRVADVMSKSLITAAPDDSLVELAKLLVDRGIHRVPITEGGRLVGIVTTLDIVRLVADERVVAP